MIQKPLGKTQVTLPEVGLGTWQYNGGVAPLRKGLELGALLIDTAESYGSEDVVGQAIKGIRDKVFLATKVSPAHFRYADLLKAADQSLRRLAVDHIDLYQLHCPNFLVPMAETLEAMEKLVEAGKVRFLGVSNFSVGQLKKAQQCLRKNRIVSNQVRYSLVDRTIEPRLLPYCQANGLTVIAYSPLARSLRRILDGDPRSCLARIAKATGKTAAQIAINWCLCKRPVVAIPKGSSPEHVAQNCGASDWRLSAEDIKTLDENIHFRRQSHLETIMRFYGISGLLRLVRGAVRRSGT
jgi:diketogulonate reductase-like aldo/keto reductase